MQNKSLDFLDISPYMRYIHTDIGVSYLGYSIPWRCIYDYELVFLYDGELTVETESEQYVLKAGDIHIMPPFIKHRRFNNPGSIIKLFSVHFDLYYSGKENDFSAIDIYSKPCEDKVEVVEVDKELINRPLYSFNNIELPQKISVSEPYKYLDILDSALDIYNKKQFGYEFDLKIRLMQLLSLIISDMHTIDIHKHLHKSNRNLVQCVDYLNNNFNKKIDIDQLAIDNGFTPSYFRRLFNRATGKSPVDYLIDMRINHAIEYMRTGIYTISEISRLVGYDDICYFNRLFKKRKQVTPSKFLNQNLLSLKAIVKK